MGGNLALYLQGIASASPDRFDWTEKNQEYHYDLARSCSLTDSVLVFSKSSIHKMFLKGSHMNYFISVLANITSVTQMLYGAQTTWIST